MGTTGWGDSALPTVVQTCQASPVFACFCCFSKTKPRQNSAIDELKCSIVRSNCCPEPPRGAPRARNQTRTRRLARIFPERAVPGDDACRNHEWRLRQELVLYQPVAGPGWSGWMQQPCSSRKKPRPPGRARPGKENNGTFAAWQKLGLRLVQAAPMARAGHASLRGASTAPPGGNGAGTAAPWTADTQRHIPSVRQASDSGRLAGPSAGRPEEVRALWKHATRWRFRSSRPHIPTPLLHPQAPPHR